MGVKHCLGRDVLVFEELQMVSKVKTRAGNWL